MPVCAVRLCRNYVGKPYNNTKITFHRNDLSKCPATIEKSKKFWHVTVAMPKREYTVLRMSQTRLNFGNNDERANKLNSEEDPVMLINDLPSKLDVSKIMNKIMSKKRFTDASSIFVVIPTSEDEEEHDSSNCVDSMTSIHSSESEIILKDTSQVDPNRKPRPFSSTKRKCPEKICGKGKTFFMNEVSSNETEMTCQYESVQVPQCIVKAKREFRQIRRFKEIPGMLEIAVQDVGTDATTIRLRCCKSKKYSDPVINKNCSSNKHYTADLISTQKRTLSLQGCSHLPDMRIPSACSSDLRVKYDVSTQTTVGVTHKATSCSRLPHLRTPSSISLAQPFDKSGKAGSNQFPNLLRAETTTSRRNRRKPLSHTIRTTFCANTDVPKTDPGNAFNLNRTNSRKHRANRHSYMLKEDCLSENEKNTGIILDEISIRHMQIQTSRKSKIAIDSDYEEYRLCEHIESINIITNEIPNRPRWLQSSQKSNKMPTNSPPEEYCLCENKETTDIKLDYISTRKPQIQAIWKSQMLIYSTDEIDYECEVIKGTAIFPDEINIQKSWVQTQSKSKMPIKLFQDNINKDLESTDSITVKISNHKGQLQASCKSKMPTDSSYENDCIFKDIKSAIIITNQKQRNQKHKVPMYSTSEEDCLCEDKKGDEDIIIVNLYSRKSKMSVYSTDEDDCLYADIESVNIIANKILTLKPYVQATKMPIDSINEDHSLCNIIDGTITDKMLNQEPQHQSGGKSIMSIDSADGDHCLCDDEEGKNERISLQLNFQANQKSKKINDYAIDDFVNKDEVRSDTTSEETSIQQSCPYANQKSKKLTAFATNENFVIGSVEHLDVTTNELREDMVLQPAKNVVLKGNCGYQEQSIASTVELNYVCQQQSKALAIKSNCECHQRSNKSAIKENNRYQQRSKNFVNNGFCAYKEKVPPCMQKRARSKLCIAGQVQHEAGLNLKHSQMSKLITSIKKSISHKIDKTMASKIVEFVKKSKKILKTKKISKEYQSHRSIQTMPEQIPQMYPGAPGWMNIAEHMRLRSESTKTTSGFKVRKKRNQFRTDKNIFEKPKVEIKLDFEYAIKYYVSKNLELFRDLIPQFESVPRNLTETTKNI